MRTILSTALLLIAFAAGQAGAIELTAAQAQQLLGAAQQAKAGGEGTQVTLNLGGKDVVFTVTRDAVGNITAVPADTGAGIAQASIGSTVGSTGALVPSSLVQVNSDRSIVTYNLALNADGTIANLYRPGQSLAVAPVVGIPPADDVTPGAGGGGVGTPAGFTLTIVLPAGTAPGQYRPASPSAP